MTHTKTRTAFLPILLFALTACGGGGGGGGGVMPSDTVTDVTPPDTVTDEPVMDMTDLTGWHRDRFDYDTSAMLDAPMVDGIARSLTGHTPVANFQYEGPITGTIDPDRADLSDPRIHLQINNARNWIQASTMYRKDGGDHFIKARYGAHLLADGTFNSFPTRDDPNPAGVSGWFYGPDGEIVQGYIKDPVIYGTFLGGVQ